MKPFILHSPDGLGISVPRAGFKASGAAASAALRESGILLQNGKLGPWQIATVREEGDSLQFCGPDFPGQSLDELFGTASVPADALAALEGLVLALDRMVGEGCLPLPLRSAGILATGEKAVLVLPPLLVARATMGRGTEGIAAAIAGELASGPNSEPASELASELVGLENPHGGGPGPDASWFLALLVYRVLSGRDAFVPAGPERKAPGKDEGFVPLSLLLPRLAPSLAGLVDSVLADPGGSSPADWAAAFAAARAGGFFRELPVEEERSIEKKAQAFATALRRRESRRRFVRRRGGLVAGSAIAAVVLALVVGSIVVGGGGRPDLSALSPRAVVETYYQALDRLDLETLEACGEHRAIEADSTLVLNLTVILKMRTAYESKDPRMAAGAWLSAGSPPLGEGVILHGIVNLSIGEAGGRTGEASFKAAYSLWTLAAGENGQRPVEMRRVDLVALRETKRGWKIVGIERGGG